MTGNISWLSGSTSHLDVFSNKALPKSKIEQVSVNNTKPMDAEKTVALPVDVSHQSKIEALTQKIQSGQYQVDAQKVASAWLKTVG